MSHRCVIAVTLLLGAIHVVYGFQNGVSVVVPNGLESLSGNMGSGVPFAIQEAPSIPSMRYQQVYASTAFAAVSTNGAFLTHLAFRPGSNYGISAGSSNVLIKFSTTSKLPDNLNVSFDQNVGSDETTVFGPARLVISGQAGSGFSVIEIP